MMEVQQSEANTPAAPRWVYRKDLLRIGGVSFILGMLLLELHGIGIVYHGIFIWTWKMLDWPIFFPLILFLLIAGALALACRVSRVRLRKVLVLAAYAVLIFEVWLFSLSIRAVHREPDRGIECISNQRQIAIAIGMYEQDNGHFPAEMWREAIIMYNDIIPLPQSLFDSHLKVYVCHNSVYTCPTSVHFLQRRGGFGYNGWLADQCLAKIADPQKILLTADSVQPDMLITSKDDIAPRHKGGQGYVASFVDGHSEYCKADSSVRLQPTGK